MTFHYETIVQEALRSVVRTVLTSIQKDGLPGNHHLYITFQTQYPGVEIAGYLKDRHPEEITIVLQYQYWDLLVTAQQFSVTLSFSDIKEPITVPFDAVTGFVDPSVKFGLQFTPKEPPLEVTPSSAAAPEPLSADGEASKKPSKAKKKSDPSGTAQVVSMDAFRKKK